MSGGGNLSGAFCCLQQGVIGYVGSRTGQGVGGVGVLLVAMLHVIGGKIGCRRCLKYRSHASPGCVCRSGRHGIRRTMARRTSSRVMGMSQIELGVFERCPGGLFLKSN